jgi:hypothetical protein
MGIWNISPATRIAWLRYKTCGPYWLFLFILRNYNQLSGFINSIFPPHPCPLPPGERAITLDQQQPVELQALV